MGLEIYVVKNKKINLSSNLRSLSLSHFLPILPSTPGDWAGFRAIERAHGGC